MEKITNKRIQKLQFEILELKEKILFDSENYSRAYEYNRIQENNRKRVIIILRKIVRDDFKLYERYGNGSCPTCDHNSKW